jgi:hypothetical protein
MVPVLRVRHLAVLQFNADASPRDTSAVAGNAGAKNGDARAGAAHCRNDTGIVHGADGLAADADAGSHAASARSTGAIIAINGASPMACRRMKWRWANNVISISRFAPFCADRSRTDRVRNLRPRNLGDGCSLPFYSGWWGILATMRDHALRDRNPTKKSARSIDRAG